MARWIRESRQSPSVASPRDDSESMNTDSDHDPRTFTVEQFPEEPEIWWQETARMFCTNKAAVAGAANPHPDGREHGFRQREKRDLRGEKEARPQGLLRSMPEIVDDPADVRVRLPEIPGTVPDLLRGLVGCPFAPRCPSAMSRCRELPGYSRLGEHRCVKCWLESDGEGDHTRP